MEYFAYLGMVTAALLALIPLYIFKHLLYCVFCSFHLLAWMLKNGTTKKVSLWQKIKQLWYNFRSFVWDSPSAHTYQNNEGKTWHAPARWLDF